MNKIINKLKSVIVGNEEFYNIVEAIDWLKNNNRTDFKIDDIIITPFYIEVNKKYEIYYKEFDYDKLANPKQTNNTEILIKYFTDLLISKEINDDILAVFSNFNKGDFYFAIY